MRMGVERMGMVETSVYEEHGVGGGRAGGGTIEGGLKRVDGARQWSERVKIEKAEERAS